MAETARDIITEALLDIGVLAEGETPTAIQAAGALKKFNGMLDLWSIDNLKVYGQYENILPLVANKGVYTIGPGGDLNISRPNDITYASVRDTSIAPTQQTDYPLYLYNDLEWAQVFQKGLTAAWPAYGIYFDWQYPLLKAYTNPVPSSSQYSIVFYIPGILANLTIDQVVQFPPGYRSLIVSHLAIKLSGSYQVTVPESVQADALEAEQLVSAKNLQINELYTPRRSGYYDIKTDLIR